MATVHAFFPISRTMENLTFYLWIERRKYALYKALTGSAMQLLKEEWIDVMGERNCLLAFSSLAEQLQTT